MTTEASHSRNNIFLEDGNWRKRLEEPLIPGPFVILQGSIGDGMRNTTDSQPQLRHDQASSRRRQRINGQSSSNGDVSDDESPLTSDDYDDRQRSREASVDSTSSSYLHQFGHVNIVDDNNIQNSAPNLSLPSTHQDTVDDSSRSPMLSSLGSTSSSEQERQRRVFSAISRCGVSNVTNRPPPDVPSDGENSESIDSSFFVVENNTYTDFVNERNRRPRRSREDREVSKALNIWCNESRQREENQMKEMEIQYQQRSNQQNENRWWQKDGKLIVFSSPPSNEHVNNLEIIGDLSPGSTVLAKELFSLEVKDEKPVGKYQFLKIESPYNGYMIYSKGGYKYLCSGLPVLFCHPNEWLWRVTCPEGAYVRAGLELNTCHITTLPHGAIVKVTRKTVNAMGLSRLKIEFDDISKEKEDLLMINGWVSEALNPLSGQRGPILQPLPFPIPTLYRVTLSEGAVIRSGVELSSSEFRIAPPGSILKVTGRAYSEHPMDRCIERLRLAGNGGWVSVRLNRPTPDDELVVDLVGIDGSFDPEEPGKYHLYAQEEVASINAAAAAVVAFRNSTEVNSNDESSGNLNVCPSHERIRLEERCLICLTEERNATIVHGGTGHIATCLMCARVLKARGDKCPVCRQPIESVIQHFWA